VNLEDSRDGKYIVGVAIGGFYGEFKFGTREGALAFMNDNRPAGVEIRWAQAPAGEVFNIERRWV
jgi:hypothetical protein